MIAKSHGQYCSRRLYRRKVKHSAFDKVFKKHDYAIICVYCDKLKPLRVVEGHDGY